MKIQGWKCDDCGRVNYHTRLRCTCGSCHAAGNDIDGRPSTGQSYDPLLDRLRLFHRLQEK